jgi:hypothetical protein
MKASLVVDSNFPGRFCFLEFEVSTFYLSLLDAIGLMKETPHFGQILTPSVEVTLKIPQYIAILGVGKSGAAS